MAGEDVELNMMQVEELVARLTATRGALQDHLAHAPASQNGIAAVLSFVDETCLKMRNVLTSTGCGQLQDLLVNDVCQRLHESDLGKHFTATNFEAKMAQMNGYQSHIVSPESAVRSIIADAMRDAEPIARWLVSSVRTFLAGTAKEAVEEVSSTSAGHTAPEGLASTIIKGVDDVLDEWEKEATDMAEIIMRMEQNMVSSVFFQRLAMKRLHHRSLEAQSGPADFIGRVRQSYGGLLNRFRRRTPGAEDDEPEPNGRAPPERAVPERREKPQPAGPARASFAPGGRQGGSGGNAVRDFASLPARDLRFVKHISRWEPLGVAVLKDSSNGTQFQVMRGVVHKRAHTSGIQRAVTKAWGQRWFLFDGEHCDLFYWKEQPTAEFIDKAKDDEHFRATRVQLNDANLVEASAEDMSGWTDEQFGIRIDRVYVKGKFDHVVLVFNTLRDKQVFVKHAKEMLDKHGGMQKTQKEEEPVEEDMAPETPEPENDAPVDGQEPEPNGADPDDPDGEGPPDGAADDPDPGSPTATYRPGGLGVGSIFFNSDTLTRDSEGQRQGTASIVVPPRFRSADQPAVRPRLEGEDALMWLASDIQMYVTIVNDTVSRTLPKMAAMVMVERAAASGLRQRLQEMALQWSHTAGEEVATISLGNAPGLKAAETALRDVEELMVKVRMASTNAKHSGLRNGQNTSDIRCSVPVLSLALGGFGRVLGAARHPAPASLLEDEYSTNFPMNVLEAPELAAVRWLAAMRYDRGEPGAYGNHPDPLQPQNVPEGLGASGGEVEPESAGPSWAERLMGQRVGRTAPPTRSSAPGRAGGLFRGGPERSAGALDNGGLGGDHSDALSGNRDPSGSVGPTPREEISLGGEDALGGGGLGGLGRSSGGDALGGGLRRNSAADSLGARGGGGDALAGGGDALGGDSLGGGLGARGGRSSVFQDPLAVLRPQQAPRRDDHADPSDSDLSQETVASSSNYPGAGPKPPARRAPAGAPPPRKLAPPRRAPPGPGVPMRAAPPASRPTPLQPPPSRPTPARPSPQRQSRPDDIPL